MYDYIKGTITNIEPNTITLECFGIGYMLKTPNPYNFKINDQYQMYIYQHVREDLIELYGFSTILERVMFIKLINVKGLGPKGALAILAASNVSEIVSSIENGDSSYFRRFPGIGTKVSQQIILDLKGKLNFEKNVSSTDEDLNNLISALQALGYNSSEIKSITKEFKVSDYETLGDAVKAALKRLIK